MYYSIICTSYVASNCRYFSGSDSLNATKTLNSSVKERIVMNLFLSSYGHLTMITLFPIGRARMVPRPRTSRVPGQE